MTTKTTKTTKTTRTDGQKKKSIDTEDMSSPGQKTLDEKKLKKKSRSEDKPEDKREEKKRLRKEYESNKRRLLQAERENYSYIYILKTHDGWYKALSHSALLLIYYVAPKMKKIREDYKPPRLLADNDYRDKAPIGTVSFRKFDDIEKVMKACEFPQGKVKDGGGWVFAFKLDRELSETEFWDFKNQEDETWAKVNKIIVPEFSSPDLGIDIREMTKLFYDVVRKLPKDAKELVGMNIMGLLRRVKTGLFSAEKGVITWSSFFSFAPKLICEIESDIDTMAVARVEDRTILTRMAEIANKVGKDIEKAAKAYDKKA